MKREEPAITAYGELQDERTTVHPQHGHAPQRRPVDPKTGRLYRILGPVAPTSARSSTRLAAPRSFSAPPPALHKAHLDNLAIVPASLLPDKAEWQALANALPAGSTLIVLPDKPGAARAALERVSRSLAAHGSPVTTIEQHERRPRANCQETVAP
jgi:hypothetical protein